MEQEKKRLINRVLRTTRKDTQIWVRAMELGSASIGMQSARLANELRLNAATWTTNLETVERLLTSADEITFELIDKILDLLPPQRVINRFNLERLTPIYDQICLDKGIELADLFRQGESAVDRGDFDIGLNILDAVLKRDPRFYPALIVSGMTMLKDKRERPNAIRLLDRSVGLPPVVSPERYKRLSLELLAHGFEQDEKYLNAIKTLKRLQKLGDHSAALEYNISRNYAVNGQGSEVSNHIIDAISMRPSLISLALVDDQFSRVRKDVLQVLEDRSEEMGEKSIDMLKRAWQIRDMAQGYGLQEVDGEIASGLDELQQMEDSLTDGCYTVYRDLLRRRIPAWAQDFPARVQSRLGREVTRRMDEINRYNDELEQIAIQRRSMFMRVGVPLWGAFSLLILILLILGGQHPLTSLFVALVLLALGYVPVSIINRILKRSVEEQRMPPDLMLEVKKDVGQVELIRNGIMSKLRQDGFLQEKEVAKV